MLKFYDVPNIVIVGTLIKFTPNASGGRRTPWKWRWTATRQKPYSKQIALLTTIPGVDRLVAWHLIAELGTDMSVFPDADHCACWAGLSPGSCESAGKQISGRTKKGNKYLRRVMTQAAWAASRCKDGYLSVLLPD